VSSRVSHGRQIGDLLTYIFLPMICVILPYRWGQALILLVARRGWLLRSRSELALQQASRFVEIKDARRWQQSWRLVEMMEARDLWLSVMGRASSISRRIRVNNLPEPRTGLVLLGMHFGPTAIVLQILHDQGLGPRFVYRGADSELRRVVPFQWIYSKLNVKFIRQTCQGRDITVPGARRQLEAALHEPGTPVILLDAPVTREGQSIHVDVLGLDTEFSRDGPELLTAGKAFCVHYWLDLDANGERILHFSAASQPDKAESLVKAYAGMLSSRLSENSAHWRLWHAADQLFRGRRD
jgi:hypothetical protein